MFDVDPFTGVVAALVNWLPNDPVALPPLGALSSFVVARERRGGAPGHVLVFVPAFGGVDKDQLPVPAPVGVCGREQVIVVTFFNSSIVYNTRLYF